MRTHLSRQLLQFGLELLHLPVPAAKLPTQQLQLQLKGGLLLMQGGAGISGV